MSLLLSVSKLIYHLRQSWGIYFSATFLQVVQVLNNILIVFYIKQNQTVQKFVLLNGFCCLHVHPLYLPGYKDKSNYDTTLKR